MTGNTVAASRPIRALRVCLPQRPGHRCDRTTPYPRPWTIATGYAGILPSIESSQHYQAGGHGNRCSTTISARGAFTFPDNDLPVTVTLNEVYGNGYGDTTAHGRLPISYTTMFTKTLASGSSEQCRGDARELQQSLRQRGRSAMKWRMATRAVSTHASTSGGCGHGGDGRGRQPEDIGRIWDVYDDGSRGRWTMRAGCPPR